MLLVRRSLSFSCLDAVLSAWPLWQSLSQGGIRRAIHVLTGCNYLLIINREGLGDVAGDDAKEEREKEKIFPFPLRPSLSFQHLPLNGTRELLKAQGQRHL